MGGWKVAVSDSAQFKAPEAQFGPIRQIADRRKQRRRASAASVCQQGSAPPSQNDSFFTLQGYCKRELCTWENCNCYVHFREAKGVGNHLMSPPINPPPTAIVGKRWGRRETTARERGTETCELRTGAGRWSRTTSCPMRRIWQMTKYSARSNNVVKKIRKIQKEINCRDWCVYVWFAQISNIQGAISRHVLVCG